MNRISNWILLISVILCVMICTVVWLEWRSDSVLLSLETDSDNVTTEMTTEMTTEATTEVTTTEVTTTEEPTTEEPKPEFGVAPEGYFEDALFIGDSRTDGLEAYGDIKEATFFASTGMSIYNILQERDNIAGYGNASLKGLLQNRKFKRIYILLGINELGAGPEAICDGIQKVIDLVHEYQPYALVCVQANMHVTKRKNDSHKVFKNSRIDELNQALAAMADGEKVFYLDMNPYLDDENGHMKAEYSYDGIHLQRESYLLWCQCLRENAILYEIVP